MGIEANEHDIAANKHLPHPRAFDSEDLILRQEGLCQSSEDHVVECINRERRKQDQQE